MKIWRCLRRFSRPQSCHSVPRACRSGPISKQLCGVLCSFLPLCVQKKQVFIVQWNHSDNFLVSQSPAIACALRGSAWMSASRMAHLFRLTRPFLLPRACIKAGVFCLATLASPSHAAAASPPPLKTGFQGPSASVTEGPSSSSSLRHFNSFKEILGASGGGNDEVFHRLSERSIAAYFADRESVDAQLLPVLKKNRLVLFLEGTIDNPKSLASMNIVKILTQLQSVPLKAVDVTAHPAVLGFALTHG